mmetsp:Transcript_25353/g.69875  ORF Transcript_25353/g.69875 Transcript_25353/m.69875 type:complete len:356 (-) Transcript_25353:681-1748(-)
MVISQVRFHDFEGFVVRRKSAVKISFQIMHASNIVQCLSNAKRIVPQYPPLDSQTLLVGCHGFFRGCISRPLPQVANIVDGGCHADQSLWIRDVFAIFVANNEFVFHVLRVLYKMGKSASLQLQGLGIAGHSLVKLSQFKELISFFVQCCGRSCIPGGLSAYSLRFADRRRGRCDGERIVCALAAIRIAYHNVSVHNNSLSAMSCLQSSIHSSRCCWDSYRRLLALLFLSFFQRIVGRFSKAYCGLCSWILRIANLLVEIYLHWCWSRLVLARTRVSPCPARVFSSDRTCGTLRDHCIRCATADNFLPRFLTERFETLVMIPLCTVLYESSCTIYGGASSLAFCTTLRVLGTKGT